MNITDLIYIDQDGFHFPDFPTLFQRYQDAYRVIYGADIYIDADSQDGAFLALFAQSVYDLCNVFSGVYTSFSPALGIGDALTRNVAINGITRRAATHSTADVNVVGTVGTTIAAGKIRDALGNLWSIPTNTVIPVGGTITVTATCDTEGAITAAAGALNQIGTPQRGWVSVTNPLAAVAGVNAETDAELRLRQQLSTMITAYDTVGAIESGIADVDGVTEQRVYENDTNSTNSDGLVAHTIAAVVLGGDTQDIIDAIGDNKPPGCGTQGTTTGSYTDSRGVVKTINFYRPAGVGIKATVAITALTGYVSDYETELKQAIADAINALAIGEDVLITRLFAPATLNGLDGGKTYNLTDLKIAKLAGSPAFADVAIAYTEMATCSVSDITVTVT